MPRDWKSLLQHTAADIRNLRPGTYNDDDLLELSKHFADEDERLLATWEAILHSPQLNTLIAYDDLYESVVSAWLTRGDEATARRWAYAWLAYSAQQAFIKHRQAAAKAPKDTAPKPDNGVTTAFYGLVETYLSAGDPAMALTLLLRWYHHTPGDPGDALWELAEILHRYGYVEPTLTVLDRLMAWLPATDEESRAEVVEWQASLRAEATSRPFPPALMGLFHELLSLIEQPAAAAARYLPPLSRLATTGQLEDEEKAAILAQGPVLVPDLIHLAFDPLVTDETIADTAVALLRQLWQNGVVALEALAPLLEPSQPGWRHRLLRHFGKIGPMDLDRLIAFAADPAVDLSVHLSAVEALAEYGHKVPEERPQVLALLRDLIVAPKADSPAEEEDLVGFAITTALELDARELYPFIEAAFREDRVNPVIINLEDVQTELGLPIAQKSQNKGWPLLLICKKCQRYRYFYAENVIVDLNTAEKENSGIFGRYGALIIDREVVCPKCGARDQYAPSPLLMGQMLRSALPVPVTLVRGHAFGQPMHPLEAIERYRLRILTHPRQAENYMRLGTLLRFVRRFDQALAMIRKGHELEPQNPEWTLMRATAEHDLGDKNLARRYYEEAIRLATKAPAQGADTAWLQTLARKGLQNLNRGEPSFWADLYRDELPADDVLQRRGHFPPSRG